MSCCRLASSTTGVFQSGISCNFLATAAKFYRLLHETRLGFEEGLYNAKEIMGMRVSES